MLLIAWCHYKLWRRYLAGTLLESSVSFWGWLPHRAYLGSGDKFVFLQIFLWIGINLLLFVDQFVLAGHISHPVTLSALVGKGLLTSGYQFSRQVSLMYIKIELLFGVLGLYLYLLSRRSSAVSNPRLIAAIGTLFLEALGTSLLKLNLSRELFVQTEVWLFAFIVVFDPGAEITQCFRLSGLKDDGGDVVPVVLGPLHFMEITILILVESLTIRISIVELHIQSLFLWLFMKINLLLFISRELPDQVSLFISFKLDILRTRLIQLAIGISAMRLRF